MGYSGTPLSNTLGVSGTRFAYFVNNLEYVVNLGVPQNFRTHFSYGWGVLASAILFLLKDRLLLT